jgi:hypothetical protein
MHQSKNAIIAVKRYGRGGAKVPLKCLAKASATTKGEPKSEADFVHAIVPEAADSPAETLPRDRDRVVQIYGAPALHPVVHVQDHFRGHVPDGGSDGRDGHGGKVAQGAVARENKNRALLVRRREPAKANIAAVQSSGQAAASSHGR